MVGDARGPEARAGERLDSMSTEMPNTAGAGSVWIAIWLFTIGYCHLGFWQGVIAFLLWPYYLGVKWS